MSANPDTFTVLALALGQVVETQTQVMEDFVMSSNGVGQAFSQDLRKLGERLTFLRKVPPEQQLIVVGQVKARITMARESYARVKPWLPKEDALG